MMASGPGAVAMRRWREQGEGGGGGHTHQEMLSHASGDALPREQVRDHPAKPMGSSQ